jgi:hypothetical protein
MVFNGVFNDISVLSLQSTLLVEETGVPGATDLSQVTDKFYHIILSYYIIYLFPTVTWDQDKTVVSKAKMRTNVVSY